jgi:hypothetical protein
LVLIPWGALPDIRIDEQDHRKGRKPYASVGDATEPSSTFSVDERRETLAASLKLIGPTRERRSVRVSLEQK